VVIDAVVDPSVVQLPPHISFEEAKKFMSAIAKGDPQEGPVLTEAIRSLLAGVAPHRH
jgi:pyruvate dehydrogenase (quinone)